ncbi:MAG: PBP1A family penicillin-binding protein [Acidobacteria bacterium]|nr:PBP1A family penicillin-binding protein [Acidobacteriota bacterium]
MRVFIKKSRLMHAVFRPRGLVCLSLLLLAVIGAASVFTSYYVRFSRLIDNRLSGPVFPNVSQVYAAPEKLILGQRGDRAEVISHIRMSGYTERRDNSKGWYSLLQDGIRIFPGPDSYFANDPAEVRFADGQVNSIVSLRDHFARSEYALEPRLITSLFDRRREKRRLVEFRDLPPDLVNAVLAIEDRRFLQHSGVDYLRILKAAYVDIRAGRVEQGASTITMQLARSFFFSSQRTWKRKLAETLVAFQLEGRLTKEQIFEYYCNKIYMGQRGSFTISGFGEAAQAYFSKDVRDLTLPEAAFLAGIMQGPNLYSPYRNPEATLRRRNIVLSAMVETGSITPLQRDEAADTPLEVTPRYTMASEAPYFIDMVKRRLLESYSEEELVSESYRIYTTLDLKLQRAAAEAMRAGLAEVDQRLEQMRQARRKATAAEAGSDSPEENGSEVRQVEAALIALDPHTGAIKALLGGRDYGRSQFNRIKALRQPGSVFKPFVYAAALSAAQYGSIGPPWTPISQLYDEPTTFVFEGNSYEPSNYREHYYGPVTLRYALMRSLNVATVKLAQMVGYETVVGLARRAGMNVNIQPTPAVALGAYETTPLEIAGAYTIFANQGVRMDPYMLTMVRSQDGTVLEQAEHRGTQVLDPRIAFLMTNLLESAINRGTGIGVRARGFRAPAAGKTGTSHDGWFAGYTSNLLTVVWVGYDSDLEVPLSGASSALPIWTEFMKRAIALPEYHDVVAAVPPPGVVQVEIDPDTNGLATPHCPRTETEYFVAGTQPTEHCPLHYLQPIQSAPFLTRIAEVAPRAVPEPASAQPAAPEPVIQAAAPPPEPAQAVPEEPEPPKRGFFRRLLGIFGGGSGGETR